MNERTLQKMNPAWKIGLIASSIILVILSLTMLVITNRFNENWPLYITITMLIWLTFYFFVTYKQYRTVYLFTTVYVFSLLLFHCGQVVLHLFGVDEFVQYKNGNMAIWFQNAGWASMLAVGATGLGIGISMKLIKHRPAVSSAIELDIKKNLAITYWIGVGLFGAAAAGFMLTVFTVGNIFQYSRTQLFSGVGDTRGFSLFLLAAPSAAVLMCIGAVKKKKN